MKPEKRMILWESVETTDFRHTKLVAYGRRKFTSIDAYARIKRATEIFGPVGLGWGWTVMGEELIQGLASDGADAKYIKIRIGLWYTWGEEGIKNLDNPIEAYGGADLSIGKDEAYKMALTDAIGKALSYLGFSADVYLGKFDDDKYVHERKKAVSPDRQREFETVPMEGGNKKNKGGFDDKGNWIE